MIYLNLIALIIAICWMVYSKFDYEPNIAVLTLTVTLIGQSIKKRFSNIAKIKGSENIVTQRANHFNGNGEGAFEQSNETEINGNKNDVSQS